MQECAVVHGLARKQLLVQSCNAPSYAHCVRNRVVELIQISCTNPLVNYADPPGILFTTQAKAGLHMQFAAQFICDARIHSELCKAWWLAIRKGPRCVVESVTAIENAEPGKRTRRGIPARPHRGLGLEARAALVGEEPGRKLPRRDRVFNPGKHPSQLGRAVWSEDAHRVNEDPGIGFVPPTGFRTRLLVLCFAALQHNRARCAIHHCVHFRGKGMPAAHADVGLPRTTAPSRPWSCFG
jgi:hypothetical protein